MDERSGLLPAVRPAREFRFAEEKITIVKETGQQRDVVPPRLAVREVEDDWFVLLDVARKKSGIFQRDVVQLHMQTFLRLF